MARRPGGYVETVSDHSSHAGPLVCVPGLGLGAAAWRPTTDVLRRHPSVSAAEVRELPGLGQPAATGEDLRPAALGAQLAATLAGASVLLGHSASCQVVARAAVLAPDRVSALVLVGPTTDPRAATWPRLAARWLGTAVCEPPWQVPLLVRSYLRTGPLTMRRAMDRARREEVRLDLGAVRCPVLVVRGRRDRICPEDWARALARTGPAGSRAVTLDSGAHMVPLTQGDLLAAAVTTWLGDLDRTPASP